jgi:hypothetical protein
MAARMRDAVPANARGAAILLAAALLATWRPLADLRAGEWAQESPNPAAWAEAAFAETRKLVGPGERLGVLVPPFEADKETAYWYCAQYALAPALVEPVMLGDCLRPEGGPRCGVPRSTRFAFVSPDPALVDFAELRFGIRTVARAGPARLMAPERP